MPTAHAHPPNIPTVLRVADLNHLVEPPPVNLFSTNPLEILGQSGFEYLLRRRLAHRSRTPQTVVLELPGDQIQAHTEADAQRALQNFCTVRIQDTHQQLVMVRREGRRTVLYGLIALGVCLVLSAVFGNGWIPFVPEFLSDLLAEGFTIVGWISLWHPSEAFMYDRIPYQRTIKALRMMAASELRIRPWSPAVAEEPLFHQPTSALAEKGSGRG